MIVVDANVVLGALRSRNGASHAVLRGLLTRRFSFALSPAMVLEYEDVLKRPGLLGPTPWIDEAEIDTILDALSATAVLTLPWFRFSPLLDDTRDDLYVEYALAAGAALILTHDRHFRKPVLSAFGLQAMTPQAYLTL